MSRLRPLPPRKVEKVLKSLGWRVIRQSGSHAIFKHPDFSFIIVVPQHKSIKKGIIKSIINDLGLTQEEFYKLV